MKECNPYHLHIRGRIDGDDLNRTSPVELTAGEMTGPVTRLEVTTDQSGLIGLLRHLHQRGFVILALEREGEEDD
jgi:hypothetical protein